MKDDMLSQMVRAIKQAAAEADALPSQPVPPKVKPKRWKRDGHAFRGNNCWSCGAGSATPRGKAKCAFRTEVKEESS